MPDLFTPEGYEKCLRSGYCCKKATCVAGHANGAPAVGCTFLKGTKPGEYSCQLVAEGKVSHDDLAIGGGCCSPMNTDHRTLARKLIG